MTDTLPTQSVADRWGQDIAQARLARILDGSPGTRRERAQLDRMAEDGRLRP